MQAGNNKTYQKMLLKGKILKKIQILPPKKIRGFYHDTDLIKVIAGVRRCGKSCLMETIVG